ncbi:hypothetical protein C3B47_06185 [Flavobacterium columnare]|nr:hypothetical protein [Flavobacterium columnare]
MFDPRIGRWFAPDPLEKSYPGYSTYNYVYNNPLRFIDPTGEGPGDPPIWAQYVIERINPYLPKVFYWSNNSSNLSLYHWANNRNKEPRYKMIGLVGEALTMSLLDDSSAKVGTTYNNRQIDIQTVKTAYEINVWVLGVKYKREQDVNLNVNKFNGETETVEYEHNGKFGSTDYILNYEVKTFSPYAKVENLYKAYKNAIKQTQDMTNIEDNAVGVLFTDREAWLKVANDKKYGPLLEEQYNKLIESGGQLQLQQDLSKSAAKATDALKRDLKDKNAPKGKG